MMRLMSLRGANVCIPLDLMSQEKLIPVTVLVAALGIDKADSKAFRGRGREGFALSSLLSIQT